jgi:hypothetical protein
MAETIRLRVEVEDDGIIVTLPGTTFRVIYRKPSHYPGLVAFDLRGDKDAGISQTNFLAGAGEQRSTADPQSALTSTICLSFGPK